VVLIVTSPYHCENRPACRKFAKSTAARNSSVALDKRSRWSEQSRHCMSWIIAAILKLRLPLSTTYDSLKYNLCIRTCDHTLVGFLFHPCDELISVLHTLIPKNTLYNPEFKHIRHQNHWKCHILFVTLILSSLDSVAELVAPRSRPLTPPTTEILDLQVQLRVQAAILCTRIRFCDQCVRFAKGLQG